MLVFFYGVTNKNACFLCLLAEEPSFGGVRGILESLYVAIASMEAGAQVARHKINLERV